MATIYPEQLPHAKGLKFYSYENHEENNWFFQDYIFKNKEYLP
jgi:hypothetical protein